MRQPITIPEPKGKLGILLVGLGAVATTTIAGIMLARRGLGQPFGSLTQMATIRLGKRTTGRTPKLRDFVPLASIDDLEFGAWDIFPDNAYEAAVEAKVLQATHLDPIKEELRAIRPMPGVFLPGYVKRLQGTHVKPQTARVELVDLVRADIRNFKKERGCDRLVAIWAASTEAFLRPLRGPRVDQGFRGGPRGELTGHLERAGLRLGVHQGGGPLRQRSAEPLRGLPGRPRART